MRPGLPKLQSMSTFVRATVLGLATGSRSSLGLAALAATVTKPGGPGTKRSWVDNPWLARAALLACAGELIGDKLPKTPSRLEVAGLVPRLVLGGVGGAVLAHREGKDARQSAAAGLLGSAGAAIGSYGGAAWRRVSTGRLGRDWPGAVLEDAAAIATITYATRAPAVTSSATSPIPPRLV
jgi:uncharacterized membrane protein